tara:strand:+ start:4674 stop:5744 length:1071 start_codon:yes stop_codon:yes gene_type:complete
MKSLLSVLLFIPILGFSQYTAIPDENFEQALIDFGHDDAIDGQVFTANISTIDSLNIDFKYITSLEGIEDFLNLIYLSCVANNITSLDVSNNASLKHLICSDNFITSLDLSQNLVLESLDCGSNQLTNLNLTQNLYLTHLSCYNNQLANLNIIGNSNLMYLSCPTNQLTDLNLSGCSALNTLICAENLLVSLDISMCPSLGSLICVDNQLHCLNLKNGLTNSVNNPLYNIQAEFNPNLNCIEVDNPVWATQNLTNIDNGVLFSTNCDYPSSCFISSTNIKKYQCNLSIYPNPTNNLIQIEIENYNGSFVAELFDFTGKLIETADKTSFSLADYPTGIYLLKVAYTDRVEHLKVVKK